MPWFKWSKTATNNATADPTINWAEGQAPSSVNDSARAEMAAGAKFRDDISGTITTAGTSTAYTLTTNSVFDTLANMSGAMVAFVPHATNGATPTLNVDGLGAKALRSAPSVELPDGALVAGTPYVATYFNATNEWILQGGISNPYQIPLGGAMMYFGTAAPNSAFALPFGQAISRTTFATLFTLFGTTFGAGDGSTTFNIPDIRGRLVAGKDDMGGSAASRLTSAASGFGTSAAVLGAVGGAESHTLTTPEIPVHTHTATVTDPGHAHTVQAAAGTGALASSGGGFNFNQGTPTSTLTTTTVATGVTVANANAGSGNAHTVVQPTIIANYILRII